MMNYDFTGKTALVTGASRGIGRAIAEGLLNLGAKVTITSTNNDCHWSNDYDSCQHRVLDFMDLNSVAACLGNCPDIDILINNAGVNMPEPIFELNDESWNNVLMVNLSGPMKMMRTLSKRMMIQQYGRVVNISSIAAMVSKPGSNAYSSSKAGLLGLTRATALDLAPYGVLVNAVCPGPTQTDMVNNLLSEGQRSEIIQNIPLKRLAKVDEIAAIVIFLCSDMNTYITGQAIVVDGGATII